MMPQPFIADESRGYYRVEQPISADAIIQMAHFLAKQQLSPGQTLDSPEKTYTYLQTLLQQLEHEVFGVLWLDQQHRLIVYQELFQGTINQAQVYPREVVKHALKHNAAAVILVHNHPSGNPRPSESDKAITQQIKQALQLIEVRLLDHVVVGREGFVSLAQLGEI